jgi:trypsin-like peptidase
MKRFLRTLLGVAAVTASSVVAVPAASAAPAVGDLASTIALSNCSASLVRFPSSQDADAAMMLTNGHCYEGGMPGPGAVLTDRTSSRSGTLLDAAGGSLGTVRADRLIYATMTGTDVALYRLNETFAAIQNRTGATAMTIRDSKPADGTAMFIPSGYWERVWECSIEGFVHELREADWTFSDSVRYRKPCETIGGTSGSPIVDSATREVIGVNNTSNEDGGQCTLNNPCEVDAEGNVTVDRGRSYGQQTYWFTTCTGTGSALDLTRPGCLLPKP